MKRGFPKFVGNNVPVWKQEVDANGVPVGSQASGEGCGLIVLFVFLIPWVITAALCALPFVFILKQYLKNNADHKILTFKDAFKICFKNMFLYFIIYNLTVLIVYLIAKVTNGIMFSYFTDTKHPYIYIGITLFILQIPSILICAGKLRKKLLYFSEFEGPKGYWTVVRLLSIAVISSMSLLMFVTYWVITYLLHLNL